MSTQVACRFKPANDYVLIKREEKDEQTPGGIHLPSNTSEPEPTCGVVVAVGEGRRNEHGARIPVDACKIGDTVHFSGYGQQSVEIDGEKFLVLREADIIGTVQG